MDRGPTSLTHLQQQREARIDTLSLASSGLKWRIILRSMGEWQNDRQEMTTNRLCTEIIKEASINPLWFLCNGWRTQSAVAWITAQPFRVPGIDGLLSGGANFVVGRTTPVTFRCLWASILAGFKAPSWRKEVTFPGENTRWSLSQCLRPSPCCVAVSVQVGEVERTNRTQKST